MKILFKNTDTGKTTEWSILKPNGTIWSADTYIRMIRDDTRRRAESAIKANLGGDLPELLLTSKQIDTIIIDTLKKGQPSGLKSLREALEKIRKQ